MDTTTIEDSPVLVNVEPMTAHNRCNGTTKTGKNKASMPCCAQAYVRWVLKDQELEFCVHHSDTYGINLELQGFEIEVDYRATINQKPGASVPLPPSTEGNNHGAYGIPREDA